MAGVRFHPTGGRSARAYIGSRAFSVVVCTRDDSLMQRTERPNVELLLKRAYEKPARTDEAVSPSTTLRKWFGYDPDCWHEFEKRYKTEPIESERKATTESRDKS